MSMLRRKVGHHLGDVFANTVHTYLKKYKSLKVPCIIIYLFTGLLKETLFTNFLIF